MKDAYRVRNEIQDINSFNDASLQKLCLIGCIGAFINGKCNENSCFKMSFFYEIKEISNKSKSFVHFLPKKYI